MTAPNNALATTIFLLRRPGSGLDSELNDSFEGILIWRIDDAVANGIPELGLKVEGTLIGLAPRFWMYAGSGLEHKGQCRDQFGQAPQPNLGRMPSILDRPDSEHDYVQ